MAAPHSNPKASSAPSSSSGFGKYFRRAPPPNRSVEPRADQKKAASSPSQQPESERPMQRSAVFGSCAQSVGTVASVLFAVINHSGHYDESARDSTVTRQAKILYVSLLESVQKARGEWQGFSSSSSSDPNNNNGLEDTEVSSPRDLLMLSIDANSTADQLGVLNELLEVSFRNLMGPLVPVELYTRHKKVLLRESLAVPPALTALLAIRGVLDRLEREVRHCLLRLLALWDLIALVSGETQPLLKTIADKHHRVFSESSEFESMTARKSERQDTVAIDLLQIMVLYREILFSDIEFILTRQEMQINAKLIEDVQTRAWPPESEPAALSEEEDDRFSSDGDVSSSISSDENQVLHDDLAVGMAWSQDVALQSLRPRSLSVPSVEEHQYGEYYNGKDDEGGWSIPSPTHFNHRHRQDRKLQRSQTMASPPMSGGAGPLVPVPMIPSSSEGIPPPNRAEALPMISRPIEGGRRHPQRSLSANIPDSPTHSATSHASSNTRSSSRNLKLRTKKRSSSSINGNNRIDRQRHENHWQDTASSESRSPLPPSRSTMRRNTSKRIRGSKSVSGRRRKSSAHSAEQSVQDDTHRPPQDKIEAKPATPSFLSLAASSLAIPVAAATLCVIATMATLAIYEMRRAPRN